MNTTALHPELLAELTGIMRLSEPVREPVRIWSMSGVERLHLPGSSVVYKYARTPFDQEYRWLTLAAKAGVPVPSVLASARHEGWLGMLLEDLGTPRRETTDADGAVAAVALHQAPVPDELPVLDTAGLQGLPGRALDHLARLRAVDRWTDQASDQIHDALRALAKAASDRAQGCALEPFGWVHSEFHPTSLHIGPDGWRLLDFARAFTGPGLLDLASWHGTLDDPDPAHLAGFLDAYVTVGGHRDALAPRAGLPAEDWALGWHRVWAVEWFMDQAIRWINNPVSDPAYIKVVRRHLIAAVGLLRV